MPRHIGIFTHTSRMRRVMARPRPDPFPIGMAPFANLQLGGTAHATLPAEILAEHTMALPGGRDWPVRRATFEAILRRLSSARGQE